VRTIVLAMLRLACRLAMSYERRTVLDAQRGVTRMGKKSWSWGRIDLHDPPLGDNPFLKGLSQWLDSPEGELADEAREVVWPLLDAAQIDVEHGTITWPEAKPLDIQQSVLRIHEDHPRLTEALIEDKVIAWLELEYAPDNYSSEQMDELERHIDRWIKRHHRQMRRQKTR
jgi:hypothetical protein